MASTYLIRSTPSETFSKLTVSCWFKGMADGTQRNFWGLYDNTDNTRFFGLYLSSNGSLYGYWKQGGEGVQFTLGTMQKFRDPSAWYHFVMTMDTTLGTASDRVKFYVNGERVTSFEDSLDTITQSKTCNMMNGTADGRMQWGGGKISGTQYYWNGSMSHCHMCVGYAYDASSFGSTDSTTGEWKINTSPSVSYGTNGGFWLKDGSQLTDSSSNSNTLTVGGGTLTNTEDCPSNVFATMNPLLPSAKAVVDHANGMSNGNLHNGDQSPNNWQSIGATIAATSGKFYWEFKIENVWGSTSNTTHRHGIANYDTQLNNNLSSAGDVAWTDDTYAIGWQNSNGIRYNNSVTSGYGTYVANDILMFAMDLDNLKLYVGKNGTWENSGDPTSGSTGTGAYTIPTAGFWCPYSETKYGSDKVSWNIGNGYFKTTVVSSEGTNASNIGKFEYDVPANYTALCTKGLNE